MISRILMLCIIYAILIAYMGPKWKELGKSEHIALISTILVSLYLSLDYIIESDWPVITDLINITLAEPAKKIVGFLKSPS